MEITNIQRRVSFLESAKDQQRLHFHVYADLTKLTHQPTWDLSATLSYRFNFRVNERNGEDLIEIHSVKIKDFQVYDMTETKIMHLTGQEYRNTNVDVFLRTMNLTLIEFLIFKRVFEEDSNDFLIQFFTGMKHKLIAIPEPEPSPESFLTIQPKCENS